MATPAGHISTVHLNILERLLTATYWITPTSSVKENLLPIVKATRGGGQRKGESQTFRNIQRHFQHSHTEPFTHNKKILSHIKWLWPCFLRHGNENDLRKKNKGPDSPMQPPTPPISQLVFSHCIGQCIVCSSLFSIGGFYDAVVNVDSDAITASPMCLLNKSQFFPWPRPGCLILLGGGKFKAGDWGCWCFTKFTRVIYICCYRCEKPSHLG